MLGHTQSRKDEISDSDGNEIQGLILVEEVV